MLDELAQVAAEGDTEATATLTWAVRHFALAAPAIRQYLFRAVDIDAAEQQTLIAVAYRIGSFRGDARFTTWLHRVAANEAKQVIRSEARHRDRAAPPVTDDTDEAATRPTPRHVSSLVADQVLVQRELDGLPDRLRQALVLREHQGHSYQEIAEILGVPQGTAKTWVRRGRLLLAQRLTVQLGLGDEGQADDGAQDRET